MGLRLDAQFIKTDDADLTIALLANLHYRCPAYLFPVTLPSDPTEHRFIQSQQSKPPFEVEELSRGIERYWYDMQHDFEDGIYEAQSVYHHDYLQTVWLKIRSHRIAQVTTNLPYALTWYGFKDITICIGCGHTETVRIYGGKDRIEQAIAQYQTANCKECHQDALYIAGAFTNRQLQCAPLLGTPKQLRWAEQIRARILQPMLAFELAWDEFLAHLDAHRIDQDDAALYLQTLKEHRDKAQWWIGHREVADLWAMFRYLRDEEL